MPRAATLREGTTRASLLHKLVPVLRAAVQNEGLLTTSELAQWHARDLAIGQHIVAPVAGIVRGVGADGALLVRPPHAAHDTRVHTGSMIFLDPKSPLEQSAPPHG